MGAVRNMSAVEGAGAEAAAVKHPVYQGFEAHRDGSYQGIIPPQSKTFHGSRFPMLAEFLKGKGWKLAAAGQVADLSFQPEAKWQNESATEKPARVCLLSRAITDLMSNKRSFARALSTAGCAELTPETYLDVDEWEAMMKLPENAEAGVLYFLKMANGSWGSDVHPVRTIDHVYQKIGADAAGMLKLSAMPGMPRAASVLPMAVLDAMKQELITGAAAVDPKVLEQAFANAFVNAIPPAKMATAKKSYLIQKGVEKPLLVNGGRKYVLRIYVVAVLRPTSGVGSKPMPEDAAHGQLPRKAEVYCCDMEIGRPQKLPYDPNSDDFDAQVGDSKDLYVSTADGSQFEASRWTDKQFPQIKSSVQRMFADCFSLQDEPENSPSYSEREVFQKHFGWQRADTIPVPGPVDPTCGRLSIFGLDYIADEDDHMTCIEINGICNLTHTQQSELDMANKMKLCEGLYSLLLAPLVEDMEPHATSHFHRVV